MIVTTAITAVTPTMIPTSVKAVRSLFDRRLLVATLKASKVATSRIILLPTLFVRLSRFDRRESRLRGGPVRRCRVRA